MLSDPIADMLTRIRNASMVAKKEVVIPYSKLKEMTAKVLVKEGYLKKTENAKLKIKNKENKFLICELRYKKGKPAITKIKRLSRPGVRFYSPFNKLPRGLGITIVSTSKGLMTNREAKKKKLGGELICRVW